ncbi:hypothetical protein RF11_16024 [Thelohanellus kitauei]|uniref:Uncharacterized protein n=1 Tax=Thelohanellus kitauei TaxID=669202 RepID=A0A0C2MY63_THEKT|nr:hypothetical protein RF11_16024 [Thelohanellus kitauei]
MEDSIIQSDERHIFSEFLMYFEDTFIGGFSRQGRLNPLFNITLWNQRNRVMNSLPTTNNNIEGWHRAFSSIVSAHHPNIFAFLSALKLENSLTDHKIDIAIINTDVQGQRGGRYDCITNQIISIIENRKICPI